MNWPQIIIVNGTSSSGKSTLCKAMQDAFAHPYLYFAFDTLIMASPRRYWENAARPIQEQDDYAKDGVRMEEVQDNNQPKKTIAIFGPVFRKIIDAMPAVVGAVVETGNSVIYDQIYHDKKMFDDCIRHFKNYNILNVGVYCSLDVLETRERERGDRVLGRARGLYDLVHSFGRYDVTVDSDKMSIEDCVSKIKDAIWE